MSKNKPILITICGTNASGKSSLGIELAKKYQGEIISADSRQVIRGFDLCCGKVTEEEKAVVPHHMIDICNIGDDYSVTEYQNSVYGLMPQISQRGSIPFIVGGTGLYIDAVVKGYDLSAESVDPDLRKELESKSIDELRSMLSSAVIEYLQRNNAEYNNKRRIIRAIEKEVHGHGFSPNNQPLYNTLQIGVTWPKEILHKRIDERLKARLEEGMIEEVRSYLHSGGSVNELYKLGLEYKYIAWYVEGRFSSINDFAIEMSRAIKRYAKQQMKWFKRNTSIHWVDMTGDYYLEACKLIDSFLGSCG